MMHSQRIVAAMAGWASQVPAAAAARGRPAAQRVGLPTCNADHT